LVIDPSLMSSPVSKAFPANADPVIANTIATIATTIAGDVFPLILSSIRVSS
jgi:hypothetical protein